MKKLFLYVFLGLFWCNVGFGADYLKIPIIKELLKGKNNLDYECYYPDGKHAGSFRIDMKNKIVNEPRSQNVIFFPVLGSGSNPDWNRP